ncbi:MAG: biotin--[acetyl-CoA-carboxylase] ligase [Bdellovibrionaceae bacterium]|jgi:BirA family transcriptional regulator, biotin operon repressor / biotin---[acetyl-CoA-carboxylase] ligase|nr:biotin--[acetyl-CoA-carboxylase] ligase [Pseudobdellovibrionaceae bacterium]
MSFSIYTDTAAWAQDKYKVHATSSTTSTNDMAKESGFSSEALFFITEKQSKGRGRGHNSWSTGAPGHGLLCSFSYLSERPIQPIATPLIGLAIFKSLQNTWPHLNFSLKAPNDIFLEDKKIAGILVEALSKGEQQQIIIGLGLNALSAPKGVDVAGFIGQDVTSNQWLQFLNELDKNLKYCLITLCEPHISKGNQEALTVALKKYPNIANNFDHISEKGDLVFTDHTTHWTEL